MLQGPSWARAAGTLCSPPRPSSRLAVLVCGHEGREAGEGQDVGEEKKRAVKRITEARRPGKSGETWVPPAPPSPGLAVWPLWSPTSSSLCFLGVLTSEVAMPGPH